MQSFYVTTAIDYPNGRPHLGHAYEKTIADALARWHRLAGEHVFFLTGTDENSQKIPQAAQAAGIEVHQFLEQNVALFKQLCTQLNTSHTAFIRTTDEKHKRTAQDIFKRVHAKGDIYKGTYEGYYCVGCERFYTEKDLDGTKCPVHKRDVNTIKEESYFFTLSKYQARLVTHIKEHPEFIQPEHKRNEILNRLEEPLRDLSISRQQTDWGIPLPTDRKHSMYVWFDALTNYLSGIDYPSTTFDEYWPHSVHIIGKDITWFHTVIWPIMLLAADLPLPHVVHSHGFVNLKGQKLSKSTGTIIDPLTLIDKYGEDPLRYYLLREIPAGQDGDFSEDALITRANADLADALGNLVNRALTLVQKHCNNTIPSNPSFGQAEHALAEALHTSKKAADTAMRAFEWHRAAEHAFDFVHTTNKYINAQAPWKEKDTARRDTILYTTIEALRNITLLTHAFIPRTSENIARMIGQPITTLNDCTLKTSTRGTIIKPDHVFTKFTATPTETHPFSALNLKVGIIKTATDHPNADKLYILTVDLGSEERTLVAGLKSHYSPAQLIGKHAIILTNLKPAKIRGIESHGMVLAADKDERVTLLEAPHSKAGEQVTISSVTPSTTRITYDEFAAVTLHIKNQHAYHDDKVLTTPTESVQADIADGARVR